MGFRLACGLFAKIEEIRSHRLKPFSSRQACGRGMPLWADYLLAANCKGNTHYGLCVAIVNICKHYLYTASGTELIRFKAPFLLLH